MSCDFPQTEAALPERFYVCPGLRLPYAILDRQTDTRLKESANWRSLRLICRVLNAHEYSGEMIPGLVELVKRSEQALPSAADLDAAVADPPHKLRVEHVMPTPEERELIRELLKREQHGGYGDQGRG